MEEENEEEEEFSLEDDAVSEEDEVEDWIENGAARVQHLRQARHPVSHANRPLSSQTLPTRFG